MKTIYAKVLVALAATILASLPVSAAEVVTYYHNDYLGSPIAATDDTGAVVWQQAYDPWGFKLTQNTDERGYTGNWLDEATGLADHKARWYTSSIGRFTAIDPVKWQESNIHSFNRYAYANNSPYKFVDPDGRAGKIATLIRLIGSGSKELGRITKQRAVRARLQGENVHADSRQAAQQIERAAAGNRKVLKHKGHKLADGSTGNPHYQTEGLRGHTFWGTLGSALMGLGIGLDHLANGVEIIDPTTYLTSGGDRYLDPNGNEVSWDDIVKRTQAAESQPGVDSEGNSSENSE
ncbi:RHS repeat domain-containing protein [Marinobacter lacisalsi]|uniref:RHS repeat domain-containing protein n=1 Tax=Marinobacter lacisalsi TaxID=475979 RepID=A0ABV8QGY4_9GAMM